MRIKKLILYVVGCLFSMGVVTARAQSIPEIRPDTLKLPEDSVVNIFLKKNLLLLAQRFNIDAQKAQIEQAKLFPNPTFNISSAIYQTKTNAFFPFGNDGEIQAGLSQVILLAGKHNKQVKIATTNATLSVYQFDDLLRTLKYTLLTDYYNIHFMLQSAGVYSTEINALQKVVTAFEQQNGKGYISEKELIRIKAQLYSLQSEYNDLRSQINDTESELRQLLQQTNVFIVPQVDQKMIESLRPDKYPLSALIDSANNSRPDLKISKLNTDLSIENYNLQKAMAVPDLTLNLNYDQQGSYIHNLATLGVAIDLPFFNRNQGNIRSAKALINYNKISDEAARSAVSEEIYNALQKAIENDNLLKSRDSSFENHFTDLLDEVLKNYRLRNISLLDFLDFYDSYKQNALQINAINFNRVSAFIDLNYYTGINYLK